MSGWLGKKAKDVLTPSRSHTPVPSRSTTPQPPAQYLSPRTSSSGERTGLLTIRVLEGRGITLPPDVSIPPSVEEAVKNQPAHQRKPSNARESIQRRRMWWIPYCVLEYDKNEIMIDALGGQLSSPNWYSQADFDVSRTSDITISAYLRTQPVISGLSQPDMGNDILLSRLDLSPALEANAVSDQWYRATWGTGEFRLHLSFKPIHNETLTIDSFDLLSLIGKGSFGKVMQVRKKDTGRIYALKTIRKAHIASRPGEITHILAERTVLALVNNPFIVPLKFSFQTPDKLYLVMSFVNGGELFYHLQREGRFDQSRSRFYAAELLCALEHLHSFNVVYRDLKPENILLDFTGHIALCDFGLCKLNMSEDSKTNTFCGTPEYIAPELLESKGYTKTVDWWTLGVLIFEMLTGLPPFYDQDVNKMYQRILHDTLRFPDDMSTEARSIIAALLKRDPTQRLGVNGSNEIKKQPFFSKIDWHKLLAKKIQPPFKPSVTGLIDVSNFDPEFTSEVAADSLVTDSNLSETVQDQFRGFTYNPANEHLAEQFGSVTS
ncbi:putative Serine/threonine-protein kinase gad8 [Cantharellus anzutake]|uniref:putative Serine/threonine-protein kinase gad8 n=1 Tax=Cantharellus anzutake TaxID=1750568 RepID=UPI001908F6CB|nr:putative Serine/threonine-protein kinase gad8 [Cantharellus anzutake]KAF8331317.1 putative Serine/threonine-protein kinase gad8 [Cantharellus anzutake]